MLDGSGDLLVKKAEEWLIKNVFGAPEHTALLRGLNTEPAKVCFSCHLKQEMSDAAVAVSVVWITT